MKMSNLWFVCVTLDGHWSNALKGFGGGGLSGPASVGALSLHCGGQRCTFWSGACWASRWDFNNT